MVASEGDEVSGALPAQAIFPYGNESDWARVAEAVQLFIADLNSCDVARLETWFTADSVLCLPPAKPRRGAQRIVRAFGVVFREYQVLSWHLERTYVQSATVAFGMIRSWGKFRDGRDYANTILSCYEFDSTGKLVALSDYFSDTSGFRAPFEKTRVM